MSMSDPFNRFWYNSEPLEVPYSPNQFFGWDFFAVSDSKPALDKMFHFLYFVIK